MDHERSELPHTSLNRQGHLAGALGTREDAFWGRCALSAGDSEVYVAKRGEGRSKMDENG